MNVNLTEELEELVRSKVASGMYGSASEVVRDALRLFAEREQLREARLAELRRKIDEGWESAERGDLIPGEQVFAELREMSRKRRSGEE